MEIRIICEQQEQKVEESKITFDFGTDTISAFCPKCSRDHEWKIPFGR